MMAFDLSTARPVSQEQQAPIKKGFDLSTARPVIEQSQRNATDDMSTADKFAAGAGKFVVDTGRGLEQAQGDLAQGVKDVSEKGISDALPDWIGPNLIRYAPPVKVAAFLADAFGITDPKRREQLQQNIEDAKQRDADLMSTTAGKAGYVAGGVASGVVAPAGVNLAGRAVVGGAMGATQPVAEGESRAVNTAIGATAGAVIPPAVDKLGQVIKAGVQREAPALANAVGGMAKRVGDTIDNINQKGSGLLGKLGTQSPAQQPVNVNIIVNTAKEGAEKAGIPWDSIDDGMKARITAQIEDAMHLGSDLPPEALARKAVYEAQGIKPTRAMITRDFGDAFNEQNLMREPEGMPIRDAYSQANKAVRENIQKLAPDNVQAKTEPEFGAAFRQPVEQGEQAAQKATNEAYKAAQDAEGANRLNPQRLVDYIQENAATLDATNAGKPVIAQLKKMGIISDKNMQVVGTPNATQPYGLGYKTPEINLKELSELRQFVNRAHVSASKAGDEQAVYQLGEMRGILNDLEEGAGGDLYKAYRKLRTQKGNEYENNPLIDKLLSSQKGYKADLIPDSEVFDKVVIGSTPEAFGPVWNKLDDNAKDLTKAQLAKYIEDEVFSGMGTNEAGDVVASAAKLNRLIDRKVGYIKLKMILGEENAKGLQLLGKTLREISNPVNGTVPQGSAPAIKFLSRNILGTLRSIATKTPIVGDVVEGIAQAAEAGAKSRANQMATSNALDPLLPAKQAAQEKAAKAAKEEAARRLKLLGGVASGAALGSRDQSSR